MALPMADSARLWLSPGAMATGEDLLLPWYPIRSPRFLWPALDHVGPLPPRSARPQTSCLPKAPVQVLGTLCRPLVSAMPRQGPPAPAQGLSLPCARALCCVPGVTAGGPGAEPALGGDAPPPWTPPQPGYGPSRSGAPGTWGVRPQAWGQESCVSTAACSSLAREVGEPRRAPLLPQFPSPKTGGAAGWLRRSSRPLATQHELHQARFLLGRPPRCPPASKSWH